MWTSDLLFFFYESKPSLESLCHEKWSLYDVSEPLKKTYVCHNALLQYLIGQYYTKNYLNLKRGAGKKVGMANDTK